MAHAAHILGEDTEIDIPGYGEPMDAAVFDHVSPEVIAAIRAADKSISDAMNLYLKRGEEDPLSEPIAITTRSLATVQRKAKAILATTPELRTSEDSIAIAAHYAQSSYATVHSMATSGSSCLEVAPALAYAVSCHKSVLRSLIRIGKHARAVRRP